MDTSNNYGIVFNIQRFTVHDGPGIRTEIFLKGCHLRCKWCSNPESLRGEKEVGIYANKCIGTDKCGACLEACPIQGALISDGEKIINIDREKCNGCMNCAEICPTSTLKAWGQTMSLNEVMDVIRNDQEYYNKSGGGVTISGGEALYQWQFTKKILELCQSENIHTCVETALAVNKDVATDVLKHADMVITDIKHMDNKIHEEHSGAPNSIILNNIEDLIHTGTPTVLRIPVIPGFNDSIENISDISNFILENLENKVKQVQLLRFRRLGEEKYESLGLKYNMKDTDPPREEFENRIKYYVEYMNELGIPAFPGTTNKITL